MRHYPTLEEVLKIEDKEQLLEVHRSLLSVMSSVLVFLVSVVIVYGVNVALRNFEPEPGSLWSYLSPRWLALIPAVILIEILRKYHDDLYLFGIEKITHLNGRLSLSYSVPSIKYTHIRAITVKQDLIARLFDYGNIEVETAAKDGAEVVIEGIRNPRELALLIEDLRSYNRERAEAQTQVSEEQRTASNE